MIDFSSVYAAIKKYCKEEHNDPNEDCFATIAKYADVPINYLEYVLKNLQDKGLISYSITDCCISLTAKGKTIDKLPGL
jgi:hypothetical protein